MKTAGAFGRKDWSEVRKQGLARFLWSRTWLLGGSVGVIFVVDHLLREGDSFSWKRSAMFFGWALVCGAFWAAISWWLRERAFRKTARDREGSAA